jgi:hypothetical protein
MPDLYETDSVSVGDKIVYEHWLLPHVNFHWWIVELDLSEGIAFGYANLNDDWCAEWGYIDMAELTSIGAVRDRAWTARPFGQCEIRSAYLHKEGSDHHHAWD